MRFIKVQPTTYLLQYRGGKVVREGVGLSMFYYAPTSSLVAVPVGSTDTPFIFQETTADFQNVTIQGQVTYRVSDPRRLAGLLNYTLARNTKAYASEDPEKLPERLIHITNVLARAAIQKLPLREAIRSSDEVVKTVKTGLAGSPEITSLGLEVLGLSILAIKPTPETARALEAETRENLFREADEAIYARRNAAVQQERAIKENELNTEIAVESKKRQIRETQMEAERAVQEKKHVVEKEALEAKIAMEERRKETELKMEIAAENNKRQVRETQMETERAVQEKQHVVQKEALEAEIAREERRKSLVLMATENAKTEADARAHGVSSTMKALSTVDARIIQALASTGMKPEQLIALAFQELAGKAEKIGQLNISPDLLRELMAGTGRTK